MKKLNWIISVIKENVEGLQDVQISGDTSLIASGYIDSYDIIALIEQFECLCAIEIPFEKIELEDFETPGSILDLIIRFDGKFQVK